MTHSVVDVTNSPQTDSLPKADALQTSNPPKTDILPKIDSPQAKKRKIPIRRLIPIVLIIGVGVAVWRVFLPQAASDTLKLSGRVEADETDIGAKTGGRIKKITVKEGDFVKAGQRIADMGSSGTDRVKLHFEIRSEGSPVDPLKFLPKRQ